MKLPYAQSPHPFFDLRQDPRIAVPSLSLGFCLICKLVFDYQYKLAIDVTLLLFALFPVAILMLYAKLHVAYKRAGFHRRMPLIAVLGLISGITLPFAFIQPAHALFFNEAQTWATGAFSQAGSTDIQSAITFVFNLFRFLMVAAVLGTVAAVGFALATERDVSTMARVPAGFAAIFVIGDIFSSLLTKGAAEAGTAAPQ